MSAFPKYPDTEAAIQALQQGSLPPTLIAVFFDHDSGRIVRVETKTFDDFHDNSYGRVLCRAWLNSRRGKANIYSAVEDVKQAASGALANLQLLMRDFSLDSRKTDGESRNRRLSYGGLDAVVEQLCHIGVLPSGHHRYPDRAYTTGVRLPTNFWTHCRKVAPELNRWSVEAMFSTMKVQWGCTRKASNGAAFIVFPPLITLRDIFDARHGKQNWGDGPLDWQAAN